MILLILFMQQFRAASDIIFCSHSLILGLIPAVACIGEMPHANIRPYKLISDRQKHCIAVATFGAASKQVYG